ncbi:MAG: PorT family protein [Saprospiraceae bacterium]|nr:PorT family protein [Saprospiraceae bacterium]
MHKIKKLLLVILGLSLAPGMAVSQSKLNYGFKAGLNFSQFDGPLQSGETYRNNAGFHLGIVVKYFITDLFGVKGEFMYSQKGGQYRYEGPSALYLQQAIPPRLVRGNRFYEVDVSNDYIDIPVLGFVKLGLVELSAGFNVGLLAGSAGGGQFEFTGTEPITNSLSLNLDHRYLSDEVGETVGTESVSVQIGNDQVTVPRQLGAYYEFSEKKSNRYRALDFGIVAGASLFINEGLFVGFRVNYGFSDVTHPQMDIDWSTFDGNYPSINNDVDHQVSYQVSLGFSF